jgi:hypothetical protein
VDYCDPPGQPDLTLLARVVGLGHRVANHTLNHWHFSPIDNPVLYSDPTYGKANNGICSNQMLLDPYITDGIYLFRSPGGYWDSGVATALRSRPSLNRIVGPIHWVVQGSAPGDPWSCDIACSATNHPVDVCVASFERELQTLTTGGIVLMHDYIRTPLDTIDTVWPEAEARRLIPILKQRQFLLVPIDAVPELRGGQKFGRAAAWSSNFSNQDGFAASRGYYATFRLADVNGDGRQDVCVRGGYGLFCNLSDAQRFTGGYELWQGQLSDASGWLPEQYSSTIQFGDINGDGRADVCARSFGGLYCSVADPGGFFADFRQWSKGTQYPNFSNYDGFASDAGYYGTLRLGDVTGDGMADACIRSAAGVLCARSTGSEFEA